MPLDPVVASALITSGASAGQGLFQMIGQRRRERRAMENQRQLMALQQKHQMELNLQGQQIQHETWRNTNYGEQVKMLKEAGMNPALLYGKGGSGGITGSQGGGSASGGSAPSPQHMPNFMDLNAIANIALIKSQSKVNEAQAEKLKAETNLTGQKTETEKASLENVAADTANKKAQNEILELDRTIKELDSKLKASTLNTQIKILGSDLIKIKEEIKILKQSANVAEATYDNILEISKQDVVKSYLTNALLKSQISKTDVEAKAIVDEIIIKYEQLNLNKASLSNEQLKTQISKFEQEVKANFPNVWNVAGAGIMQIINTINSVHGQYGTIKWENVDNQ